MLQTIGTGRSRLIMRRLSFVLAVLGVLIALLMVSYYGFDNVVSAVGRIGWPEFGLIVVWQLVLFVILGLAWDLITPSRFMRRPWVLIWGRMVRDASSNCLPFSQVGGFVFGARAVTLHGVEWHTATASTVVDVTAEFLSQIAFTCIGLGILLARAPRSGLAVPVEVGIALAVLACFAFVWVQKGAAPVFARIGRRIAGNWFSNAEERMDVLQTELGLIYGHTGKLALGFLTHLIGWICTGVAGLDRLSRVGRADRFRRRTGDRGVAECRRGGRLPGSGKRRRSRGRVRWFGRDLRRAAGTLAGCLTGPAGARHRRWDTNPAGVAMCRDAPFAQHPTTGRWRTGKAGPIGVEASDIPRWRTRPAH